MIITVLTRSQGTAAVGTSRGGTPCRLCPLQQVQTQGAAHSRQLWGLPTRSMASPRQGERGTTSGSVQGVLPGAGGNGARHKARDEAACNIGPRSRQAAGQRQGSGSD